MSTHDQPGTFDRLAAAVGAFVARAPFFAVCLAFVVGWAVLLPVQGWNNQIWHLWLNSPTTSITFLLVALLQNTQARFEKATNAKLNALAAAQALQLEAMPGSPSCSSAQLREHAAELRHAVGLEEEVGA